ncbi:MAG TPA: hypothetical protein DDZ88_25320 [Verrucomicrobiales bacterium]|nr:hypothetical protein [Verrucomicrobiales bacterium]
MSLTVMPPDRAALPLTTGTWQGARTWLTAAQRCEQLKLFCQVMLGFELQLLHRTKNIKAGNPTGTNQYQLSPVTEGDDWETTLTRETGLSKTTAYRFMDMAKAAAPRIRKLPLLKDFDPCATPIAELDEPKISALEKTVHKLTDGLTQRQFGELLGLWKTPTGATGRAPGEGGRKKLSLGEQAEAFKRLASEDWAALADGLDSYRDKFTVLSDGDVAAQISVLEHHLAARRAWLAQPQNARDPRAIHSQF